MDSVFSKNLAYLTRMMNRHKSQLEPILSELFDILPLLDRLTPLAHGLNMKKSHLDILWLLSKDEFLTVPAIARRKGQSRQRIQVIVDQLLEDGLVELNPNPIHASSYLVTLSPQGRRLGKKALLNERKFYRKFHVQISKTQQQQTCEVLKHIKLELEVQLRNVRG